MRAFYSTHRHIRVFVFGVPEGWLVSAYDTQKCRWIDQCQCVVGTLKEAKVNAQTKIAALTGRNTSEVCDLKPTSVELRNCVESR